MVTPDDKFIWIIDGDAYWVNLLPVRLLTQLYSDQREGKIQLPDTFSGADFLVCTSYDSFAQKYVCLYRSSRMEQMVFQSCWDGKQWHKSEYKAQYIDSFSGFRPVLIPLDSNLNPDFRIFSGQNGMLTEGGTFYTGDSLLPWMNVEKQFVGDTNGPPLRWFIYHGMLISVDNLCNARANEDLLSVFCLSETGKLVIPGW